MKTSMMEKVQAIGICLNCGNEIPKNSQSILSHFAQCYGISVSKNPTVHDSMLLLIQDKYASEYWLVLRAKPDLSMKKIDRFLRDYWVECCGHLSEFSDRYSKISMTRLLSEVFSNGIRIDYVYDFGSSTELSLSMLKGIHDIDEKRIEVLFRNQEIEFQCSACRNKAEAICPYCVYEEAGLLCRTCATTHKCVQEEGEDLLMPLVNSPRVGVCGYTGSIKNRIAKYLPKDIP